METFSPLGTKFSSLSVHNEVYIKCFENIYTNVFHGAGKIDDSDDESQE